MEKNKKKSEAETMPLPGMDSDEFSALRECLKHFHSRVPGLVNKTEEFLAALAEKAGVEMDGKEIKEYIFDKAKQVYKEGLLCDRNVYYIFFSTCVVCLTGKVIEEDAQKDYYHEVYLWALDSYRGLTKAQHTLLKVKYEAITALSEEIKTKPELEHELSDAWAEYYSLEIEYSGLGGLFGAPDLTIPGSDMVSLQDVPLETLFSGAQVNGPLDRKLFNPYELRRAD